MGKTQEQDFLSKNWMLISIAGIVLLILIWGMASYNDLITKQVMTDTRWSDVETQYQRRIDLIPNLVETASKYAQFEKGTLTQIAELRSQWTNAKSVDEKIQAGTQLDSAISRLLLVYENYPELKTVETFNNLMVQLEGTENRIAVARRDYNDAVRDYNTATKVFPKGTIAGIFGFKEKQFFNAQEGAENAPKVDIKI